MEWYRRALVPIALAAGLAVAACGGGDDDENGSSSGGATARFSATHADELAHAALVKLSALPGRGWEVTAQDAFDDDDDDAEFLELAKDEPACATISNLAAVFGGEEDDPPAGRAQVEFERAPASSSALFPSSVEVEVEIEETVVGVQGGWAFARGLLTSDDFKTCMSKLVERAVASEDPSGSFKISLTPVDPSADAPQNGAAVAFKLEIEIASLKAEGVMEMYMWPYSNAAVTVLIFGTREDLPAATVREVLKAVDRAVVAAGK